MPVVTPLTCPKCQDDGNKVMTLLKDGGEQYECRQCKHVWTRKNVVIAPPSAEMGQTS